VLIDNIFCVLCEDIRQLITFAGYYFAAGGIHSGYELALLMRNSIFP
jgi:hypothetical protein